MFQRFMIILSALLICSSSAFAFLPPYDKPINTNFINAKSNRMQLEQAIKYFVNKGDSLELDAIKFLIANMDDQGYVELAMFDSTGREVPFDILQYPDFKAAYKSVLELQKVHHGLSFKAKLFKKDNESITADFLIRNVELAFEAWRTQPWGKFLPYEVFRDYVLPYRGTNERLDSWREFLFRKYEKLRYQMHDTTNPVEAVKLICADVLKDFVYDSLYYFHPTDQSYSEMQKSRRGRCGDQANLMLFAARANGIALLSDYVPYWGNTGNNHNWNSVINRDGHAVWLEDGRPLRQAFDLSGKAAKVFRKTYSIHENSLAMQLRKGETAPPWLDDPNFIDVSKEYMDVSDIRIDISPAIHKKNRFAYLCVFNSGSWRAIAWAKIENDNAVFRDMGKSIVYIPALCENNELRIFGGAFIMHHDGTVNLLTGDVSNTTTVSIYSAFPTSGDTEIQMGFNKETFKSTTLDRPVTLDAGATYELFYWKNGWISMGRKTVTNPQQPLVYSNVPSDRLYWLVKCELVNTHEERIFTIENGKQIFW